MKVIGAGLYSVVVKLSDRRVRKYYLDEHQWISEEDNLTLLEELRVTPTGCKIPKLYRSGVCHEKIGGKVYRFWSDMELIRGQTAYDLFVKRSSDEKLATFGYSLGSILFSLHSMPLLKVHSVNRLQGTKQGDKLLEHIFEFKLATILKTEKDPHRVSVANEAADYLRRHKQDISRSSILCHQDLNMKNIIVDESGAVCGLVDWADFGLTHPSITLYQLAKSKAWLYIEKRYEELEGVIRKDLMYAATVVHQAWAPIHNEQLVREVDEDETRDRLDTFNERFKSVI